MAEERQWPALIIRSHSPSEPSTDLLLALLDDFSPAAIEDLTPQPLPPGGLWDPSFPPMPEPPPTPLEWRVFFSSRDVRAEAAAAVQRAFPELEIELDEVADENWAARSQQALRSVVAGDFVVSPPWDPGVDHPEGLTRIVIQPSRGFGTGHHASTRLCLCALSTRDVRDRRVLDLGTGSGVLAIAAAFKGAREVVAIDIDGDAIEAARESAALNDTAVRVVFLIDDFRAPAPDGAAWNALLTPFDLVLANLTGGMLIASAQRVQELVAPGGFLIVSGFDDSERDAVRRAFNLVTEIESFSEEGWVGLVMMARLKPGPAAIT